MGSGNKDKRKRKRAEEAARAGGQTPAARAPAKAPGPPRWPNEAGDAGVSFELEPDADQLFLESIGSMDERLVRRKQASDEWNEGAGGGSGRGARGRAEAAAPSELDLHRLTLDEAVQRVEAVVAQILERLRQGAPGGQMTLKIITGKGLHSGSGGSVLPREIHRHVRQRFQPHIVAIEESPADVTLGGVPMRGHFHVTFGRK